MTDTRRIHFNHEERLFMLWLKKQTMLSEQDTRLQGQVENMEARLNAVIRKLTELHGPVRSTAPADAKAAKDFKWDHLPPDTFKQPNQDVRPR